MYGQDNYGLQQGGMYGSPYGAQDAMGPSKPLMGAPNNMGRRRMNLVASVFALFLPWGLFCGVFALQSFSLRYTSPALCTGITVAIGVPLFLFTAWKIFWSLKTLIYGQPFVDTGSNTLWTLFIGVTMCVAFALAVLGGSYNYNQYMRPIFDVTALNSYVSVNPTTMRGQELMDAGKVQFVSGANLDFRLANGFKNTDVYCVAPITVDNAVLSSYDFWAVGKNCCSDQQADFKCGAYNLEGAKGGVRVTSDADRDFYRLAVQQAQSSHAIKAIHPLFFTWTTDASTSVEDAERAGYQGLLVGMFGHFLFQSLLVVTAVACFAKVRIN
eukprot:gb/GFBE01054868.1/.p1 GENE.gb/GFBE01054868.1/~~gb/GFBE01054868.1/.p1  ORF type:complete len:327 (+),score=66.03 gb/GFBE01054868.1/:1-981(+)